LAKGTGHATAAASGWENAAGKWVENGCIMGAFAFGGGMNGCSLCVSVFAVVFIKK